MLIFFIPWLDGDDGSRFRRALDNTLSDLLAVLVRSNFKMIGDLIADRLFLVAWATEIG